jgi:hypothetical protein
MSLRDARVGADQMNALLRPARSIVPSAGQNAAALNDTDNMEAVYFQPLRIFNNGRGGMPSLIRTRLIPFHRHVICKDGIGCAVLAHLKYVLFRSYLYFLLSFSACR